jgi:hypothetical protein
VVTFSCHSRVFSNCLSYLKPLPAKRPRRGGDQIYAMVDFRRAHDRGLLSGKSLEHAKMQDAACSTVAEFVAPLVATPPPDSPAATAVASPAATVVVNPLPVKAVAPGTPSKRTALSVASTPSRQSSRKGKVDRTVYAITVILLGL